MKKTITLLLILLTLKVSAQSGITWNTGSNLNTSAAGNEHPRIAMDRSGNAMVVWHHNSMAMFSRWNGTVFTAPGMVNPMNMTVAGASWMGPDIASHGDTVYIAFKQMPEGADTSYIFCVHSYDAGMTFSAPVQINNIADSISRFPAVTTDDMGNPIVAFMKFNPAFGEARWVVSKSTDFGMTFSVDHKASGWSAPGSLVCDCCPGAIACSGNMIAMLYRDNNSNIRDTWAGISTNGGNSFSGGMNVDQQNWMLMMCPSAGPDAVIIGDTLYSAFMNGNGGMNKVYFSRSSISAGTGSAGIPVTGSIAGLSQQNYPRMASSGNAIAIVWKQIVSGTDQCVLRFTDNIANGLPAPFDTVDLNNITNADIAMQNGKVWVVWQDDGSGTIKYRSGAYTVPINISVVPQNSPVKVYPNPAGDFISIDPDQLPGYSGYMIYDMFGKIVQQSNHLSIDFSSLIDVSELANGTYILQPITCYWRVPSIKFIISGSNN